MFAFLLRLLEIIAAGGSIADACRLGSLCKSGNVLPDGLEDGGIEGEDSDVVAERNRVNDWDLSDEATVSARLYSLSEVISGAILIFTIHSVREDHYKGIETFILNDHPV